jgi:hypothetical protein
MNPAASPLPSPIRLLDEAVHLLRRTPSGDWLLYAVGTMPFLLALAQFWHDMATMLSAPGWLGASSLLLALAYLWMKCWQSEFCARMLRRRSGDAMAAWDWNRLWRLLAIQAPVQPLSLFLLPLTFFPLFPFPATYSFFVTVSAAGAGQPGESALQTWARAARLARIETAKTTGVLLLGAVVSFILFVNIYACARVSVYLFTVLSGVDTALSLAPHLMVSSTFLFSIGVATFPLVNALSRAVFVLRRFYLESTTSGADLAVDVARFESIVARESAARSLRSAAIVLLALASIAAPANAAHRADDFERSAEEVLNQDIYDWRHPEDRPPPESTILGEIQNIWAAIYHYLGELLSPLGYLWNEFLKWLYGEPMEIHPSTPADLSGTFGAMRFLLISLAVLMLGVLVYMLWRGRRKLAPIENAEIAQTAVPDLEDESVTADQMPENEWLALARDLQGRGEFRLAMRALFLCGLAILGDKNWVKIARFKTNRTYQREIHRRARDQGAIQQDFAQMMFAFESVWYGEHTADASTCRQLTGVIERIQSLA